MTCFVFRQDSPRFGLCNNAKRNAHDGASQVSPSSRPYYRGSSSLQVPRGLLCTKVTPKWPPASDPRRGLLNSPKKVTPPRGVTFELIKSISSSQLHITYATSYWVLLVMANVKVTGRPHTWKWPVNRSLSASDDAVFQTFMILHLSWTLNC